MAVCGRCFICGYKFSCTETDEAVAWRCQDERCRNREHKICVRCHDVVEHGLVDDAVADLLVLVMRRSDDGQPKPAPESKAAELVRLRAEVERLEDELGGAQKEAARWRAIAEERDDG